MGGDARSGLIVFVARDEETFSQLSSDVDPKDDQEITVVAGGQPGAYSARYVVSLDLATTAVRWFLEKGGLAEDLRWVTH